VNGDLAELKVTEFMFGKAEIVMKENGDNA
jgi:hypothetical protein